MSRQFAFAAPMIAALAVSVSVSTIFTSGSHAAETCLTAPKGAAPEGSHWYYRTDRPSQRKCWRLVKLDQQPQRTATLATPQPEPADDEDAAPPVETTERIPQPVTQHGWLTRSASAVAETAAGPGRAGRPRERARGRSGRRAGPRPRCAGASERSGDFAGCPTADRGAEAGGRCGAKACGRGARRCRNDPIRFRRHRGIELSRGGDFLSRRSQAADGRAHADRARRGCVRNAGDRRPDIFADAADAPDAAA